MTFSAGQNGFQVEVLSRHAQFIASKLVAACSTHALSSEYAITMQTSRPLIMISQGELWVQSTVYLSWFHTRKVELCNFSPLLSHHICHSANSFLETLLDEGTGISNVLAPLWSKSDSHSRWGPWSTCSVHQHVVYYGEKNWSLPLQVSISRWLGYYPLSKSLIN